MLSLRQNQQIACLLIIAARAQSQDVGSAPELVRYRVSPSAADSSIHRFNAANYVVLAKGVADSAPLLVFMPGTNGEPARSSMFDDVAAEQGYRVIGLSYDDTPAVQQYCPPQPDPRCAEQFREKRIFGTGGFRGIDDRPEESIVNRLVKLLVYLDREHPSQGWSSYLRDGQPRWDRIAVSGLSQGAGMAAFIAQRTLVARVVLFSSPWDSYGRQRALAPWVTRGNGATPRERWFSAYHAKEPTADLIQRAYKALKIPDEHIRVFTLEPNGGAEYHPSGVANGGTPRAPDGKPAYLDDWKFLLGAPGAPSSGIKGGAAP